MAKCLQSWPSHSGNKNGNANGRKTIVKEEQEAEYHRQKEEQEEEQYRRQRQEERQQELKYCREKERREEECSNPTKERMLEAMRGRRPTVEPHITMAPFEESEDIQDFIEAFEGIIKNRRWRVRNGNFA